MKRIVVMAIGIVLALSLAASMALGQEKSEQSSTKKDSKTAELGAAWWQWALKNPTPANPLVGSYPPDPETEAKCDGEPVSETPGEAWFLAGSHDGQEVERHCTAPAETHLFFPVVNVACVEGWDSAVGDTASLHPCAHGYMDNFLNGATMFATVDKWNDGKNVKDVLIKSRRADSPLFTVDVPDGNPYQSFGLNPGVWGAVADGVWVKLPPLPEGEHKITFGGNFPGGGFSQDNTYVLTVQDDDDEGDDS